MYTHTYLLDFCAIIVSSITLYDGLSADKGIVAVYGKGSFAHTLYKSDSLHSSSDVVKMLRENTQTQPQINQFEKGPIFARVCLTENEGIKGLEDYLTSRGFHASDHVKEQEAAKIYLDQSQTKNSPSGSSQNEKSTVIYNHQMGREMISAISTNQVSLWGRYSCANNANQINKYHLEADLPQDLGPLVFKSTVKLGKSMKGLIFINGSLRILTSNLKPEYPFNIPIWEPLPKFDASNNNGLIRRNILDAFFYLYYDHVKGKIEDDLQQRVLLGCYN